MINSADSKKFVNVAACRQWAAEQQKKEIQKCNEDLMYCNDQCKEVKSEEYEDCPGECERMNSGCIFDTDENYDKRINACKKNDTAKP